MVRSKETKPYEKGIDLLFIATIAERTVALLEIKDQETMKTGGRKTPATTRGRVKEDWTPSEPQHLVKDA